jgi:protein gp37
VSAKTGIQWTDATWNPITGCEQVSPGCAHCYAKVEHDRRHKASLAGKKVAPQYAQPFEVVQLHGDRLDAPLRRRKPTKYFVTSGADPFHDDVPEDFLALMFAYMACARRHTFQLLTKRPARGQELLNSQPFREQVAAYVSMVAMEHSDPLNRSRFDLRATAPDVEDDSAWPLANVWLGVSVENQRFAHERIPLLLSTNAAVRFLSCEPLLGPVDLTDIPGPFYTRFNSLDDSTLRPAINWVIVGGESGRSAREFDLDWARTIIGDCKTASVPVFVKQVGRYPAIANDAGGQQWPDGILPLAEDYEPEFQGELAPLELHNAHGSDMAEWPEWLRVREFPAVRA